MTGRFRPLLLSLALLIPVAARAQEAEACRRAIAAVEPGSGVPAGLLGAVAIVESGRADPATGRPVPWPWTWNVAGEGRFAATKAEAVAAVAALLAAGTRSVDVGCMQVNLFHHPDAFPDLDAAFDPPTNVRYAARFLLSLRAQTGEWGTAVARYHSAEEARGVPYSRRVALAQLGAGWGPRRCGHPAGRRGARALRPGAGAGPEPAAPGGAERGTHAGDLPAGAVGGRHPADAV
ncbi:transglycosylase SLT domain-containing protein [Roseomonas sp. CCTCC AB2023176]|uniref:transglycosylase SLT domain-containing protein n=1 Tax=Roseomonas sp. CCTCC AB2023176 TaxID=3342640 RepID=UPI0035DFA27F